MIEEVRTFLVGPPSYLAAFRRPDGRLHRVCCTGKEVMRADG